MQRKLTTLPPMNTNESINRRNEANLQMEFATEIAREKLRFLNSIGVSQEAIAAACGVNRRTIYNWLNKRSQKIPFLAAEKILKISEAFSSITTTH